MDFVAIDVETANADMASICQIGLVKCENGNVVDEWATYVDPEDYFDDVNVSVHGITESAVEGAPTFPELIRDLRSYLERAVVVCHTHFDRVAMHQAAERYRLKVPVCTWLDSARVARRAWRECAWSGYGLYNVCKLIGYEFKHHDALEDAKAAARIMLAAIEVSGLTLDDWLTEVNTRIGHDRSGNNTSNGIKREGNPDGPLSGEVLVFTGAIGVPRQKAAEVAAHAGCDVSTNVTKKTTILVVGDQDVKRLAGHHKSAKHRKAEALIEQGAAIRILRWSDFSELIRMSSAAS